MSDEDLGPGVRRMRPDDHFMILTETDATPMHIGSLQYFDVPAGARADFYDAARKQIAQRLPHTPLLSVLRQEPEGYDSDIWVGVAECDLDYHVVRVSDPLDEAGVRVFIAQKIMERLDLSKPPFRVYVFDNLADGRAALYSKVHHSVTDGIGFQTILACFSDDYPPASHTPVAGSVPDAAAWRAAADAKFAAEAQAVKDKRAAMDAALGMLRSGELAPRAKTPTLRMSAPTSNQRAYETLSLPLARVKALSKKLDGTVNDIFLTIGGTAIRNYLLEINDLPSDPIVVNSARSYRDP
ncbi:MAG: wax ester/triacylglycerol synthase domain-containing protein, partial [Caulobacterales bacterium]